MFSFSDHNDHSEAQMCRPVHEPRPEFGLHGLIVAGDALSYEEGEEFLYETVVDNQAG